MVGAPPYEKSQVPTRELFTLGGRIFNPPKGGKHMLRRAERYCCEVNTGILACNFSTFLKVSQMDSFEKIPYRILTE